MARERTITKLEIIPAVVGGKTGWVRARWTRSDGSGGTLFASFRRKSPTRWYISQITMDVPTAAVLRDVPLARIEAAANADPVIRKRLEEDAQAKLEPLRQRMRERYALKRPEGRRLDDAFYQDVARAYAQAVAYGLQPAKTIAEDADTPQGTVNRWIAAARDRGYLPKTTPGRGMA